MCRSKDKKKVLRAFERERWAPCLEARKDFVKELMLKIKLEIFLYSQN
jgi:hypothetical protein